MFYFGDPGEVAQVYIEEAMRVNGPEIYESTLEDMTVEQLSYAITYVRVAFRRAKQGDGAARAVLDALIEIHDELFCHMAARNPVFVRNYRIRNYKYLEHSADNVDKYDAMVDQYAPSAN